MSAQPRWDHTEPTPLPTIARGATPEPERGPARVLTAIALSSIAAGAIHVAGAATLGRDSAQNLAFFGVLSQANAFGSSSGSNPNGGGGASVTNGYGSSGGMTSGGGYSRGGY